jgi:hypothetical protein
VTDKERIINWVNSLTLYEKDYDTLLMLLQTNDRFFVRVMIELSKGNLILSDFETVIGGPAYDSIVESNFVVSKKIQEDLELILGANDAIGWTNTELNKSIYEGLLVSPDKTELIEEVRDDELYDFFKNTPEASLLFRLHKDKMINLFNNGDVDADFLNLYVGIPVIPINYNDINLTEEDKLFALSKGISINEMKKIKSLSYYYKSKGE